MKKNIKVILSTFGPLHLIKSAEILSAIVDIKVIQGWIPKWWNNWILLILNHIVGYKLTQTIKKRTPTNLKGKNIGIGFPEFYSRFCSMVLKDKNANIKAAILYGKRSRKYIKNADIFHVRSGSGMGGAIEKAKLKGMKVIVDHSIAHPQFMDKQLRKEYERNGATMDLGTDSPFWQAVLSDCDKADLILVNSQFVKETFIESGYAEDKIKVVYLGVRNDFHHLKTEYHIEKTIKILFTGSFGFRKGGEYLLKAIRILNDKKISCQLTVVGGINEASQLVEKYTSHNIFYTGVLPQEKLKEYLKEADIYVFPSLCEGCAQSGMEALSAGLPVIATQESGLPITHEKTGYIIPAKDENAIVNAIIKITSNENMRKKLGTAAANMMDDYTWENYSRNVYKLYESLLNDTY